MKTLVLGASGQLGRALTKNAPASETVDALDRNDLDIVNRDAVLQVCDDLRPSVIVNAAAYTAVDRAEAEPELAAAINVEGARNVASVAQAIGARLIHISTDFVFDGSASSPYAPEATPKPINVYGQTKRDGELAVLEAGFDSTVVLRTAWLYSKNGSNFVKTVLRLLRERDHISVVNDQVGAPTWANSSAMAVWAFCRSPELEGVYHWTDAGEASWYDFAVAIQKEALALGLLKEAVPIIEITTEEYPTAAERPRYSALDCSTTQAALNLRPAHWRVNLRRMLKEITA